MRHKLNIISASVAVAGPVHDGEAKMPNLAWHVNVDLIKHALHVKKVRLNNDAYAAIAALDTSPLLKVKSGRQDSGTRLLLGPGTGLGCAYSVWNGKIHIPRPSEAGHADFAPATVAQEALLDYIRQRYGHAGMERVLSGPGIVNIYHFMRDRKEALESDAMRQAIDSAYSPAKAIVDAAVARTDSLAVHAADEFVRILGASAGSLALSMSATGGVYIYGSLANRLLPFMGSLEHAFNSKGRMRGFCEKIPVFVVKDPDVVLNGAYVLAH
jgi:glucokinase